MVPTTPDKVFDVIIIVGQSSADEKFVPEYEQACIDHKLAYKIIGSGREDDPLTLKDLEGLPLASVVILDGHGGISWNNQHKITINHVTSVVSTELIELIQKQTKADKFLITTCHGGTIASNLLENNFYQNLIPSTQMLMTATAKETSTDQNIKELILNLINKIGENKVKENKHFFVEYIHDNLITVPESLTYVITEKDKLHKKTLHLKNKYLDIIQQQNIDHTSTIERYQAYLIKEFNEVIKQITLPPCEGMVLETDEKNIINNIIRKEKNKSKIVHYETTLLGYHINQITYDDKHRIILDKILKQCRDEEMTSLMNEMDVNGYSTLLWVAETQIGQEILAKHPKFINETALNTVIQEGNRKDESALIYLAATKTGQEILAKDPKLIHEETFNTVIGEGRNKGQSVLVCLASTEIGQKILAKIDPQFIHETALNAMIQEGPTKGRSALFYLARTETGREILAKIDPKLIHEETLNAVIQEGPDKDESALFWLAGTETGREILAKIDPKLIHETALNTVIQQGPNKGQSTRFWLNKSETGREILTKVDPKFTNEFTKNNKNKVSYFFENNKKEVKNNNDNHLLMAVRH